MATKKASTKKSTKKGGAKKAGAKKPAKKSAAKGLMLPIIPNPCVMRCIRAFILCVRQNPANHRDCVRRLARCLAACA
ncbi:MAG TPA: hypothetical protein VFX96_01070 [Pyrinomonadaceae bacterium]|nr:hypothetical protein [Pyrinomonadaceae bacterium]